jgi:hypothetical protein
MDSAAQDFKDHNPRISLCYHEYGEFHEEHFEKGIEAVHEKEGIKQVSSASCGDDGPLHGPGRTDSPRLCRSERKNRLTGLIYENNTSFLLDFLRNSGISGSRTILQRQRNQWNYRFGRCWPHLFVDSQSPDE